MEDADRIKVFIRARPLLRLEVEEDAASAAGAGLDPSRAAASPWGVCWRPHGEEGLIDELAVAESGSSRAHCFDGVIEPTAKNSAVFSRCVAPLVGRVLQGVSCCCFAYGQTGSGKTFTMLGTRTDPGVLPCAIKAVFDAVAAKEAGAAATVTCRMSYLEIYNEEVNDLLQAGEEGGAAPFAPSSAAPARGRGRNLKLLGEDPLRGALVEGLREVPVYTWAEVRRARRPPRPPTRCARAPRGAH
jgi:hypothetical protein